MKDVLTSLISLYLINLLNQKQNDTVQAKEFFQSPLARYPFTALNTKDFLLPFNQTHSALVLNIQYADSMTLEKPSHVVQLVHHEQQEVAVNQQECAHEWDEYIIK